MATSKRRLSMSALWRLQQEFYQKSGPALWAKPIIPSFVTSNAFTAKLLARQVLAFAKDWFKRPEANRSQPLHIIELGSGHAKLGFHLCRKLEALAPFFPAMEGKTPPFKVIISDYVPSVVEWWRAHPRLKEFARKGLLDFAVVNVESLDSISLLESNVELSEDTLSNPPIFVCNYLFSSLRQEAFRVREEGEIQLGMVSISLDQDSVELDPTTGVVSSLKHLKCDWRFDDVPKEELFEEVDDPTVRDIVQRYSSTMENRTFLMPLAAFDLLRQLKRLFGDRYIMFIGDKGYAEASEFPELVAPHVAIQGCVSMMVNMHSIGRYAERVGGFSLKTPHTEGFKIMLVGMGFDQKSLPEVLWNWRDGIEEFGPETFATLQRTMREEAPQLSLDAALALLRCSDYDCDIFYKLRQVFLNAVPYANARVQRDLTRELQEVEKGWFCINPTRDVAFVLARLFMGLRVYERALNLFELSKDMCGEHHVAWYNIGLCLNQLGKNVEALEAFTRSAELKPDFHDVKAWQRKVKPLADAELEKIREEEDLAEEERLADEAVARVRETMAEKELVLEEKE